MSIFLTIIGIASALIWISANIYTAKKSNAKEMHQEFVNGQCLVGKIFTNIFYSLAWILKLIKCIVVMTIK